MSAFSRDSLRSLVARSSTSSGRMERVGVLVALAILALVVLLPWGSAAQRRRALAMPTSVTPTIEAPSADDFVRVEGTHFVLRGSRFRFLGANTAVVHGPRHRAALEATFDAVVADGLGVVRVWALGEQPSPGESWAPDYGFRVGVDGWVESSFEHLDRVLDAARTRGLKVVLVLANRWGDYGGIPRYLEWCRPGLPRVAGGGFAELALPSFFASSQCDSLYAAHLERIVSRVNSRTGLAYRDDPTILAWELINESDAPPRHRPDLVDWTRRMASRIHALDPHHLVAAGHIGYTRRSQRATWLAIQRLPEIDYADAHAYPTAYRRVRSLPALDDYVDDVIQLAHHVAHKPFVWGELGFTTNARRVLGRPRTQWLDRFLTRSDEDGADGALVWAYVTSTERLHDHGIDVDGPDVARTADVRAVLARHAHAWSIGTGDERNARLTDERGETPIWSTDRDWRGPRRAPRGPHRERDGARTLGIAWSFAPEHFVVARAEQAGRYDGFALRHVYFTEVGRVSYRFLAAASLREFTERASQVVVRFRASSELPGRGEGASAEDGSRVRVRVDGVELGLVDVPPDDGLGRWVTLEVSDPVVLAALSGALRRGRAHALTFEVDDGPRANGLTIYGDPTGAEPLPDGEVAGPITLTIAR